MTSWVCLSVFGKGADRKNMAVHVFRAQAIEWIFNSLNNKKPIFMDKKMDLYGETKISTKRTIYQQKND